MNTQPYVEQYLDYLRDTRRICPARLKAAEHELRFFHEAMASAGSLASATTSALQVQDYLERRCAPLGVSAARSAVSLLKDFFSFLVSRQWIQTNPIALLPLPKLPAGPPIPKALSLEDVDALFATAAAAVVLFFAARDTALLGCLYALALRASEVTRLSPEDLDFQEGTAIIRRCKAGGERRVPLPGSVAAALRAYLAVREPFLERVDSACPGTACRTSLFVSRSGRPLDRIELWHWLRALARRAGLEHAVSPHQLRHSCATHMVRLANWPLFQVAAWLGHSTQESTRLYAHLFLEDVCDALSHHPLAARGGKL